MVLRATGAAYPGCLRAQRKGKSTWECNASSRVSCLTIRDPADTHIKRFGVPPSKPLVAAGSHTPSALYQERATISSLQHQVICRLERTSSPVALGCNG